MSETVTLDPNDPFDAALIPIVLTNRKKRKDYAVDGDPFTNFDDTSTFANFENRWLSALFNCSQKLSRIKALRKNGRLDDPQNEGVEDTLLDNAVYGVISYAIFLKDKADDATLKAVAQPFIGGTTSGEAVQYIHNNITPNDPAFFEEDGHTRKRCWAKNFSGSVQCTLKAGHTAKHSFEYGDHVVRPL